MKVLATIKDYAYLGRGILNAYSQVFFSDHPVFALLLIATTFLVPAAGFSALAGVLVSLLLAHWLGFDKGLISKGILSYNVVLVTLPLGLYFDAGFILTITVLFATLFTFFLTIAFRGWMMRYGLPFLSWPFLIGLWVVMLATRQFSLLEVSDSTIFNWNRIYEVGGIQLVRIMEWLNDLSLPAAIETYLISLGAVFFQYSILAGLVVAVGLLLYSRIAFVLSLLGFFSAVLLYRFLGLDINSLNYTYIGFNFILMSIAIGGFYLIPGWGSFLWVVLLVPLVTFISVSMETLLGVFNLSVYALPFNLVVPLFLYVLHFRNRESPGLQTVVVQNNSPEKNLYAVSNYRKRLGRKTGWTFHLPFLGEWAVSQGHDGAFTHQGEWRHAWDFVKKDPQGKTYSGDGSQLSHYYCYDKPVFAVADGYVDSVVDGVPDNIPGDANTRENWGNTVIIRHQEGLYSKYSHLKAETLKVLAGQYVMTGQELGLVGNSGRSPEPHLHFQFQKTPYIDSTTLLYPFSHYLVMGEKEVSLQSFDIPQQSERIKNLETDSLLKKSYHFIPGQRIKGVYKQNELERPFEWEVVTDVFNQSFIKDRNSSAKAWFVQDGQVFYFSHFEGARKNPLYCFFLSQFQIPLFYNQKVRVLDSIPLNISSNSLIRWTQDWVAPFFMFLKTQYKLIYYQYDDDLDPDWVRLRSEVAFKLGNDPIKQILFETWLSRSGLFEIRWTRKGVEHQIKWIER